MDKYNYTSTNQLYYEQAQYSEQMSIHKVQNQY